MYKVFFNDRIACFGDDFSAAFRHQNGLFVGVSKLEELPRMVEWLSSQRAPRHTCLIHPDLTGLWEAFKGCFTILLAGGGLVFNGTGQFLAIHRNGYWDLPKGKLEKHEGFEEAALREVEEETGLKQLILEQPLLSTYHTYREGDGMILKQTRWFGFRYLGEAAPILESAEGITDYRWVQPGETAFFREQGFRSLQEVLMCAGVL